MDQIALIVHACDRYQLLYQAFEYFFKKNWPYQQVNIKYYFLTEEADHHSDVFTNIKTGQGEWSDRLLNGLNQIPEEYVIYMQEDMWISRPVSADTLLKTFEYILEKQYKLLKLSSNPVYVTTSTGNYINGLSISVLNNKKSGQLMSHQPSIWKKTFLSDQLQFNEDPWVNVSEGTRRIKDLSAGIYHIDLFSENGNRGINNNGKYLKPSRYYAVSENGRLNSFAIPFIRGMKNSDDEQIKAYALKLEHHYNKGLTHDGQGQPLTVGVFKKMANALKGIFGSE